MVSKLIYYKDTHEFYDKYYDEIENTRLELQDLGMLDSMPDSDLKNYYSWLTFEHKAFEVFNEIEGE
jgi:hypothetical protein